MSLHKKFQGDYFIIIIIELYLTRVKNIDYWSPSSFHNGPPLSLVVHHTVHTGAYWYKTGGTYACAFSENPKS